MGLVIVLGPVPCQGCRQLVIWDGWHWMHGKHRHVCPTSLRAKHDDWMRRRAASKAA